MLWVQLYMDKLELQVQMLSLANLTEKVGSHKLFNKF